MRFEKLLNISIPFIQVIHTLYVTRFVHGMKSLYGFVVLSSNFIDAVNVFLKRKVFVDEQDEGKAA